MKLSAKGHLRGFNEVGEEFDGEVAFPDVNTRGDLIVCQSLPVNAELVRMRLGYFAIATTAVAPVTAVPTTAAQVTLHNNYPAGGPSLIVHSVFTIIVVSAAAATGIGLFGCMNAGLKAVPTTNLLTPKGLCGTAYRGSAVVATGQTITNDNWHPLSETNVHSSTNQVGTVSECSLRGLYIVPPGHMFSISQVANTATTITARAGIRWFEVNLPAS